MDDATESAFLGGASARDTEIDLDVVQTASTARGMIEASKEADLLVLGAAREGILSQLVFGEKTRTMARGAHCAVLLAKRRRSKGLSLLRRLFTRQEG